MTNSPPRRRLSYANVAATLALVLATSMGGAYAHGKIGSAQLKANAVKSKHIANGNVKTADLGSGAVATGKLRNRAVTSSKLAPRVPGVALAGASVSGASVVNQFNRLGGPVTVSRPVTGTYVFTIPGASFSHWSNVVATFGGPILGSYCFVNDVSDGNTVEVRCRSFTENAKNPIGFSLVLHKDSVGAAARAPAPRGSASGE